MKRFFVISIILSLILGNAVAAQALPKRDNTTISNGFWVIESNIKTPKNATIFFYNANQDLVYKESIVGKRLNVNRPKVRKQLNDVLAQSVTAWNIEQVVKENQQWVVKRK